MAREYCFVVLERELRKEAVGAAEAAKTSWLEQDECIAELISASPPSTSILSTNGMTNADGRIFFHQIGVRNRTEYPTRVVDQLQEIHHATTQRSDILDELNGLLIQFPQLITIFAVTNKLIIAYANIDSLQELKVTTCLETIRQDLQQLHNEKVVCSEAMQANDGFTLLEDLEDYEQRYSDAVAGEAVAKAHKFDYERCLVWWKEVKDHITVSIRAKDEELDQAFQALSRNEKKGVQNIIKGCLERRKLCNDCSSP